MRDKQEQLEWEARVGRLAALAALLAAALLVASVFVVLSLPHGQANARELLIDVEGHKTGFLWAAIASAAATLAFAGPLLFLHEATRFRRPEMPPLARALIIVGPLVVAATGVWIQLRGAHAADQFTAGTVKTKKHAEDLYTHGTTAARTIGLAGILALAFGVVIVSLNAMRAGLLSRFMGILGIVLGVILVVQVIPAPVIQLFWVLALGALFLGQWPGGRGPAWETGDPDPWPVPQRALPPVDDDEAAEPEPEPTQAPVAAPNPRASRKRKKRKAKR